MTVCSSFDIHYQPINITVLYQSDPIYISHGLNEIDYSNGRLQLYMYFKIYINKKRNDKKAFTHVLIFSNN